MKERQPLCFLIALMLMNIAVFGAVSFVFGQILSGENQPQLVVQLGHANRISSLAFSPDGQYAVTGSRDATAVLWELKSAKQVRRFVGHLDYVNSVAFSPDGKLVLTGSSDKTARLWEVETGKEVRRFAGHPGDIESAVFSPDGNLVLTVTDREERIARLWEAETGKEVRSFAGKWGVVTSAAFSPDGKYVLIGADQTAQLWEIETARQVRVFVPSSWVLSVAFSPDGKRVFTGGADKMARLWDLETGNEVARFVGHVWEVNSVAFSRDGRYVLTGSGDRTARLWEVESGKEVRRFDSYAGTGAAFSPDGRVILTASGDEARLWDFETGKETGHLAGYSGAVRALAISPDQRYLATGVWDRTAQLWDLRTGKRTLSLVGHKDVILSLAFSRDGMYVLTGSADGTARLWEVETGKEVRRFDGDSGSVDVAVFSLDNRYVLTQAFVGPARLWDVATGQQVRTFSNGGVSSAAFSPDSLQIATGGYDGRVQVWEIETGKEVHSFTIGNLTPVKALTFSPDGKYVATIIDRTVGLWEVSSGRLARIFRGHSELIWSIAFSPDGKYLLTGGGLVGGGDWTARLWEVETGKEVHQFAGHSASVQAVGFSPDGKYAFTGSLDSTTRLWDVASGKEVCSLISLRDGNWVVITPDGRFDASDLEELRGLHWVVPDDPMKPLPLEIFTRDYYEPGLLPRFLNGEKFKETRKLSELNRLQPQVKITGIERQKGNADLVTVTVKVAKTKSERQRDKQGRLLETGIYDLRLFRDGQIVGQYVDGKPQALAQSSSDKQKLLAWRNEAQVKLDATGTRFIKFENIKLPRQADLKQVEFSAYAFNEDRVKSQTDRKQFDIPADLAPRKGRAYVITVGVNACENPAFDLKYSVNDARLMLNAITEKLQKSGEYETVIPVPLLSDYKNAGGQRTVTQTTATKRNVKAVLDLLAGRQVDARVKKQIPNAEKLEQARPEDLVLLSFSSHGYADQSGNFYFVLYDTGTGTRAEVTNELLQHALSSEELSLWLRDVDGGEMLMIVDACHSAAAVAGGEFKPGPMGSRGLGQLSYDKGMRILTATQAADVAYGIGALKQGLLTYVLVKDGIEAGKADFKPKDNKITISEWLAYGEQGVPKLLEEVSRKAKEKDAPVELKDLVQKTLSNLKTQRPSLFDFSRKKRDVVLVEH